MATARLDSLDLGVLSVVASFGYPEELVGFGVALGKDRGAELMSLTATVDNGEWAEFSFGSGRPKESNCFPFEYIGPAFASRCKCCCPSFRTVQVATKPDGVEDYVWYRDY